MSDFWNTPAWRDAYELIPYGILVIGGQADLMHANVAGLKLLGLPEIGDVNFLTFLDNPEARAGIERRLQALDLQESAEFEIPLRNLAGQVFSSVVVLRCINQGGTGKYYLVLFHDISMRKAYEAVIEGSFDNFMQTTISLDAAMKKINEQKAVLQRYRVRMLKELQVARSVQKSIVPRVFPATDRFESYGLSQATDEIGGDYLDAFEIGPDRFASIVADVSGHGVGPALIATMLRAYAHELFRKHPDLKGIFGELNRIIYDTFSETGFYLTAFGMIIDPAAAAIHVCAAGHDLALCFRGDDVLEWGVQASCKVIGAIPDAVYGSQTLHLQSGDLVVVYTDGITECRSPDGGFFGRERLERVIRASRSLDLPQIVDRLMAAMTEFAAGEKTHDDQTILLLRWK